MRSRSVRVISLAYVASILTLVACVSVLGALLGTQAGRDVEIVNTFELAVEGDGTTVDHGFLVSRRDQCLLASASLLDGS